VKITKPKSKPAPQRRVQWAKQRTTAVEWKPPIDTMSYETFNYSDNPGVPVALLELKSHHCRWPIGDPVLFCGADKMDGSSYCRHHHGVGTQARVTNQP
jgi:hypothetical protein